MSSAAPVDPFGLVGYAVADRYRIEAVVAEGGFGVVYRAVQLAFDKPVAFKALKVPSALSFEMQRAFVEQFRLEAKIISTLDHPAIVRVIDYGVQAFQDGAELPWMVLEWVDGPTLALDLAARRGRGGRSPEECLELMRPVLEALETAHQRGVAHRDLKPGNLMFRTHDAALAAPRGRASSALSRLRLLDFGIAKVVRGDDGPGSGHTQTSSIMPAFSPHYAAPEQLAQTRTGPWTDVHALGLIFTELLLDAPPYATRDKHQLAIQVLDARRPTPARFGLDVGPWEPVLARALALDPRERYAHAGELLDALEGALPRASLASPAAEKAAHQPSYDPLADAFGLPPPAPKQPRLGWPLVVSALAATGAIATGVVALTRSTREPQAAMAPQVTESTLPDTAVSPPVATVAVPMAVVQTLEPAPTPTPPPPPAADAADAATAADAPPAVSARVMASATQTARELVLPCSPIPLYAGVVHAVITFGPQGAVRTVDMLRPSRVTVSGSCMAARLRQFSLRAAAGQTITLRFTL